MPRLIKVGALGEIGGLRKVLQDVDSFTLATIEHTGLYVALETMLPSNSTLTRKVGVFLALAVAYNTLVQKLQSAESSGKNR